MSLLLLMNASNITAQTIEVTDDVGRQIRLAQPAQRIISLAPHLTELTFSAGAGKQLVGVSRHCDYPAQAQTLPQVSDYRSINYEQIVLLKPDVVLVWQAGLRQAALKRLGMLAEAVYVSAPQDFADIAHNLKNIGRLSGNDAIATQHADMFLRDIMQLGNRYQTGSYVPVIYLIWAMPPITVNGNHWISRILNLCGGHNVYADLPTEVAQVSRESLLLNHTAVIITSRREEWLPASSIFMEDTLIQRPSLRVAEAAERMCKTIFLNR